MSRHAHMLRKFSEAMEQSTRLIAWILLQIGQLYQIVEKLRESKAGPALRKSVESAICQLGLDDPKFQIVVNPPNASWEPPFTWPTQSERGEWVFVGRLGPGHKEDDHPFVDRAERSDPGIRTRRQLEGLSHSAWELCRSVS